MKLPKPHLIGGTFLPISGFEGSDYGYTEAQMLQFRRDALEEAANSIIGTYGGITAVMCSNLVRKMKDET